MKFISPRDMNTGGTKILRGEEWRSVLGEQTRAHGGCKSPSVWIHRDKLRNLGRPAETPLCPLEPNTDGIVCKGQFSFAIRIKDFI